MHYPFRQKSARGQPKPFTSIGRTCKTCGACFIGLAPGKTGEQGIWDEWRWYCSVECAPAKVWAALQEEMERLAAPSGSPPAAIALGCAFAHRPGGSSLPAPVHPLPAPVVTSLARIGMAALPGHVLGRLAEWDRLDEREREAAAAEVRRLAGLLEGR